MLKLRLKRVGRKRSPSYRIVIMENSSRRDGRPIDEIGFYNPLTKQSKLDTLKVEKWLTNGAQPSRTVLSLLSKAKIIQV
jgi:small subunit ribosomal protein S16